MMSQLPAIPPFSGPPFSGPPFSSPPVSGPFARLPVSSPGQCIGLYGGSFDPPHEGHLNVSHAALKRMGLQQIWWLVSPQNPLKSASGTSFEKRLAAAKKFARHPRLKVTGLELALGSRYTVDTLKLLLARKTCTRFVWIMGADCFASFHTWRNWRQIAQMLPLAVFDRPGFRYRALSGHAALYLNRARRAEAASQSLAQIPAPAWTYLGFPLSDLSSTALRQQQQRGAPGL